MLSAKFIEKDFEQHIIDYLYQNGGYSEKPRDSYDKENSLIQDDVVNFIKETQKSNWNKLVSKSKSESIAQERLIDALIDERRVNGTLSLLRKGFKCADIHFSTVGWKPNTQKGTTVKNLYNANIFTCINQVAGNKALRNPAIPDIVLFVNGIPVVTIELKYEPSGQTYQDGIKQYMARNTSEPLFIFKSGPLVHFSVDSSEIWMTTKLAHKDTKFLPFNLGSNGAGNSGSDGNPPAPEGKYQTYYLWENVLKKDSLLDILQTYVTLDEPEDDEPQIFFPRYHQLDAVRKIANDVLSQATFQNYLIAHSAGSGKSNTIAWLAFQLTNLYSNDDKKIYNKIIIMNDRRVLDNQTRDTLSKLKYSENLNIKEAKNRTQLADALKSSADCIVITTLQKFPYIFDEIEKEKLSEKYTFAIIADEAHQSHGGETGKGIRDALGLDEDGDTDDNDEAQEQTAEKIAQSKSRNISYFAFTATPKFETLQLFGTKVKGSTEKVAFHTYSMCQAIKEKYILDVLQNYMTFSQYYNLKQLMYDTTGYDPASITRAVGKLVATNEGRVSRICEKIVEHYMEHGQYTIQGHGKAMVVTSGRKAAVEYCRTLRNIFKQKNIPFKVLVAFSGDVEVDTDIDGNAINKTESQINSEYVDSKGNFISIKEKQTRDQFHKNEYRFLVVADKYQTGFSEKLLSCMYVDKALSGIKAVQTLSRLNRTMTGKSSDQVFVIDFVNKRETIQESFKDFYLGVSIDKEITETQLETQKKVLDDFKIIDWNDVEEIFPLCNVENFKDISIETKRVSICKRILRAYIALEKKDEFKKALVLYLRYFNFLNSIYTIKDKNYLKLAIYLQNIKPFIETKIINTNKFTGNIEDYIRMDKFRLAQVDKDFAPIVIDSTGDRVITTSETVGNAPKTEDKTIAEIIDNINVIHNTEFNSEDVLPVIRKFILAFVHNKDFAQRSVAEKRGLYEVKYKTKSQNVIHTTINVNNMDDDFSDRLQKDQNLFKDFQDQLKEPVYTRLCDELLPSAI